MGGFGSGRPSGSGRDTVESCRSIDVNRLHEEGCLPSGWGGWQWTRDGDKVATITLRAEADRLHLFYRVRIAGGEWEDVEETVRIVRVPGRFFWSALSRWAERAVAAGVLTVDHISGNAAWALPGIERNPAAPDAPLRFIVEVNSGLVDGLVRLGFIRPDERDELGAIISA